MAPIRDEAIVLQTFPYGETSTILRLLTREHGVRSAIAKGVRRSRNRRGIVLEPFGQGTATLYLKSGRGLQTLGDFDRTARRRRLGSDLLRFGGASLLAEIVIRTGSEEAQPALFEHVSDALDHIQECAGDDRESLILAAAWSLVSRLGFAPGLDGCLECGRVIEPEEGGRFDYAAGGVRCGDCGGAELDRPLPAHARRALVELSRGRVVPLEETAAHWQLLAKFLKYHVVEGSPLRSLGFLAKALEVE